MLKLRAPEIPKHSFHGSYDLHPEDLGNKGRSTDQAFLPPLQGCRTVFGQNACLHLGQFYNGRKQHDSHLNQYWSSFLDHSILTCPLLSFLSIAHFIAHGLCQ